MAQGWKKAFERLFWKNRPSTDTPLNATDMNHIESGIDALDDRIVQLDVLKADAQVVNGMVADISVNDADGVITVTYKNGSTKTYDTNLEKIATNFTYDYSTQRLVLTLSDGSKQYVDMSALITQYEFKDSTTIAFSVDSTGKISASVKNGSITDAMLETGYLANITAQATKAESMANSATTSSNSAYDNAKLSQSYAIGGSGIREGEDADNAMYYYEQAKKTDIGQISSEVAELNSNLDTLEYSNVAGGKNLFNKNYVYDGYPDNTTGLPNGSTTYGQVTSDEIKVKPNGKYIKNSFNNANFPNSFFDENHNFIRREATSSFITVPSNAHYIRVCLSKSEIDTFQFEEGTTATEYEPYIPSVKMLAEENAQQSTEAMDLKMLGWSVPSECPVQNYIDSDGVFHQKVGRVDLGSLEWESSSAGFFYSSEVENMSIPITGGKSGYCSVYGSFYVASYQMITTQDKIITYSNSSITGKKNVCIRDTSYTDATTFKTAMQGVYLYYELETPITMTIDGNEAVTQIKNDLGGLSLSASGTTLTITDGTNTWTLEAN